MADASKMSKMMFLSSWIGVNLLGWMIGIFSGLCVGEFYLAPIFSLSFDSPIADGLAPLFVWFPIGAWIGIIQFVMMKKWKIQPILWVLATALGWGIPATLISWYHEHAFVKQFGYNSPYEYWLYGFAIVLVAASVGSAQILIMEHAFTKRGLWVLANVLGFAGSVLVVVGAIALTLTLLRILMPSISSMSERDSDFLMWIVLLLTAPLAGIIPSLGTGLYLLKYGFDGKGSNPTGEALLNPQAG